MPKDQTVIDNLGRLATKAELASNDLKLTESERAYQRGLAKLYRDAQWDEMDPNQAVA